MKKKFVIGGAIVLVLAAAVIGFVVYKKNLKAKVLALYGADTDLSGKSLGDLKQMIKVYNAKQANDANK